WGNYLVSGGRLTPQGNAWAGSVAWGDTATSSGSAVSWGVVCVSPDCGMSKSWRWQDGAYANVVWGAACGGGDCPTPWNTGTVTTTSDDGDTVVWGTSDDGDTVVWGTSCEAPTCGPFIWPNP